MRTKKLCIYSSSAFLICLAFACSEGVLTEEDATVDGSLNPYGGFGGSSGTGGGSAGTGGGSAGTAGGGAGDGGEGGSEPAPGGYRSQCLNNSDCESNLCIETESGGRLCTKLCYQHEQCGDNFSCTLLTNSGADSTMICSPTKNDICKPCSSDDDCGLKDSTDHCIPVGRGMYCGKDCSEIPCPTGSVCTTFENGDQQCVPESGLCAGCIDLDGDGYGSGADCLGIDCDEGGPNIHEGAVEICDGRDNDCDFLVDEDVVLPEGQCPAIGVCAEQNPICSNGAWNCRYPSTYEPEYEISCDGYDNDCDGETDEHFDFSSDVKNCGRCGNICTFANSTSKCNNGVCDIDECRYGYVNLDGRIANGCEYQCTFQGDEDTPNLLSDSCIGINCEDTNCDGLDGDASKAIFVDINSTAIYPDGTREAPFAFIYQAIEAASATGADVYLSYGDYYEEVELISGVNLYGGYDARSNWSRPTTATTTIHTLSGLKAVNLSAPTEIQRITIQADDVSQTGDSSIALYIKDSADFLTVRDCNIRSGRGGKGANGTNGTNGISGGTGSPGEDARDAAATLACADNEDVGKIGGNGGTSVCPDGNRTGGKGGNGGVKDHNGATGAQGLPASMGGLGGTGGAWKQCKDTP